MSNLNKPASHLNQTNIMREVYNPNDQSLAVSSFIDSKIGNKILKSNIDSVTEQYSYYDGTVLIKTIEIKYTSSTKEQLLSIERVA